MMKKALFLVFFVITFMSYSQENPFDLSLSSGISIPSSNFSNNGYAENGIYFELDGAYYFSKFGVGVSVGQLSSPTNENFSSSINPVDIPTTNTTQNWKQFYYGIGPEYKAHFGNFSATFSAKIGLQSVKSINLESNYTNGETDITILKIESDKNTSLSYFSTGLKFGYNLSSNFSLYATANYISAFSDGITISESKIADINNNGIIDAEDIDFAIGSDIIDYEISSQNIKPQSINFGIGLSYNFNITGHSRSNRRLRIKKHQNSVYEGETNSGENPIYVSNERVSVILTNPEKEKADNNGNTTKTVTLKKLADELVNIAAKEYPQLHGNNEKTGDLKKLADELVNLAVKENPYPQGNNEKTADLKKLADELVNFAVKENSKHHGDNLKYADLKELADELVNLAAKDKDSAGNINWNPSATSKVYGPGDTDSDGDGLSDGDELGVEDDIEIFDSTDNDCDDSSSLKRMNKAELVDAIAKDANLSKADAKKALESLTSNLSKSSENGNSVQLVGFQQSISARAARTVRNPQTGATIKIAPYNPQRNGGKTQRNKAELTDAIAKDANLSKADAGKALNTFMATILKELNKENCVKLIIPLTIREGGARDEDSDGDGFLESLEIVNDIDNDCDDTDSSSLKRMNKAELIDAMAKDANLSKADAKKALETLTSNLSKSSENGSSVQLVGFQQSISARAARTGRNPQTGATIKIAPYNPQRNGGKIKYSPLLRQLKYNY